MVLIDVQKEWQNTQINMRMVNRKLMEIKLKFARQILVITFMER